MQTAHSALGFTPLRRHASLRRVTNTAVPACPSCSAGILRGASGFWGPNSHAPLQCGQYSEILVPCVSTQSLARPGHGHAAAQPLHSAKQHDFVSWQTKHEATLSDLLARQFSSEADRKIGLRDPGLLAVRHGSSYRAAMETTIVGFHPDDAGDWVAELACGHGQHMRHTPPWQERPWVTTEEGRQGKIGARIECALCAAIRLPLDAREYKRTGNFTEETLPAALRKEHRTKAGTWGRIVVTEGQAGVSLAGPRARARRG